MHHPCRSGAKPFLTSREEFDIKQCLSNLPQLSLRPSGMSHDIKCYVEKQVNDLILSKKLRVRTPSLREEIQNTLSSKADGMSAIIELLLLIRN